MLVNRRQNVQIQPALQWTLECLIYEVEWWEKGKETNKQNMVGRGLEKPTVVFTIHATKGSQAGEYL